VYAGYAARVGDGEAEAVDGVGAAAVYDSGFRAIAVGQFFVVGVYGEYQAFEDPQRRCSSPCPCVVERDHANVPSSRSSMSYTDVILEAAVKPGIGSVDVLVIVGEAGSVAITHCGSGPGLEHLDIGVPVAERIVLGGFCRT